MNPSFFVSVSTEPGVTTATRHSIRYDEFVRKLLKPLVENLNALHIGLGLAGELGELFESSANAKEEFGDYEFYLQAALLHYNLTHLQCVSTGSVNCNHAHEFIYWTGQLIDCIKREYIYQKPRELNRIKLCVNHICAYLASRYTAERFTRQDVLQTNAIKLEVRYAGLYYSDDAAIARKDKEV